MKLWLDDIRTPPDSSWTWVHSVWGAISAIKAQLQSGGSLECMSLDHDLGDYAKRGGDGLKLLIWMVREEIFCPVMLHTMNPVGRENMAGVIRRYFPKDCQWI